MPTARTSPSAISWKRVWSFTVIAVIANLVIFVIGSLAGANWLVNGLAVTWYIVIVASAIPLILAAVVTQLLGRVWASAGTGMAWIGLAFAVLSVPAPFFSGAPNGTAPALAAMHVVTGVAWFMAVRFRSKA